MEEKSIILYSFSISQIVRLYAKDWFMRTGHQEEALGHFLLGIPLLAENILTGIGS